MTRIRTGHGEQVRWANLKDHWANVVHHLLQKFKNIISLKHDMQAKQTLLVLKDVIVPFYQIKALIRP